jgi:molecular chaperone Hsp33
MRDSWTKCISSSGTIRGVAIQATEICKELSDIHKLSGNSAKALSEALMSGLMVGSFCKPGERVNLNIRGTGVVHQALVDAYPEGKVRGYVVPNTTTPIADGLGPWGEGLLSILRTKDLEKQQPYIGTVPLVTGHLAKDLTFYWHQSEQVPSAVGLAVNLGEDGKIVSAGGFLIQALPGATDQEIDNIQNHVSHLSNLAKEIEEHRDPVRLLSQIFQDTTFLLLENKELHWECSCTREKVERALLLIGKEEITRLIDEGQAEVFCDFCAKDYTTKKERLQELLSQVSP